MRRVVKQTARCRLTGSFCPWRRDLALAYRAVEGPSAAHCMECRPVPFYAPDGSLYGALREKMARPFFSRRASRLSRS